MTTTSRDSTHSPARASDRVAARLSELNPDALSQLLAEAPSRPLLLANAAVRTMNERIGDFEIGDVLVGGPVIVGVGPGLLTAAGDDGMLVVDCSGMTVMPATVDGIAIAEQRHTVRLPGGTLTPGSPADLFVVNTQGAAPGPEGILAVAQEPARLRLALAEGKVVRWDGTAVAATAFDATGEDPASPRTGVWVDESGFLQQELTRQGRYDETRGGRPHAFEGSYWLDGNRIDYLDDLGFWAYGTFVGDELHHAGYVMRRRT